MDIYGPIARRIELGVCAVAAIALVVWAEPFGSSHQLETYLGEHRGELYSVSGGVYGALLGFIITATAVILDKIDGLRMVSTSRHLPDLWKTLLSTMWALGLACAAAILGLLVTAPGLGERLVFYIWAFASLLVVARVARCIALFAVIVDLVSGNDTVNRPAGG